MRNVRNIFAAVSVVALLAACSSGGDTENQAVADANEVVLADDNMAAMANDPNNPFGQSEMQMNEQMMAAVGTDAGDSWVRKMIVHHQGAIDMSRIALQQNPSAEAAKMARDTISKQENEIADLRKLQKEGTPIQQSAELYRPAMTSMHEAMMAAKGADVSETFMRKMLEHHRGGVTLSEVALNNGVSGAIRSQAQKTKASQQKEAEMVQAMLRGEPMAEAKATAESETDSNASAAAAERPAASKQSPARTASEPARPAAKPTPAPKPAPAPAPAPDPHAGHDMNNMSN